MLVAARPVRIPGKPAPLVKRFLDHIFIECGLSGATVTAYQRDLNEFWAHLEEREIGPREISMDDVQQHLVALHGRGLALSSVARHLAAIKVFLRFLLEERVLGRDVASLIETPKRWPTKPESVRQERIEALLMAPDPDKDLYLRDRALLEMLYATGMRVSEVVRLTTENTNLKLGYVRCIEKGRKERIIPMGHLAINAVREYTERLRPRLLGDRSNPALFLSRTGRGLDRTNMWRLVRKYAVAAGIEGRISPHTLRHSFATHLLAGGADLRIIRELLGHSSVNSTQVYSQPDETELRRVHKMYHPRP